MKEELDRKYKVINMMITMHSIMHHRYKTKSLIGNIFFLITAVILNIFTFFDYQYLSFLQLQADNIKNIVAVSSFTIFLLSIIFMLVEWAKRSEKHELAINQLSRLLNELRLIQKIENEDALSLKLDLFNELYNQCFETIPKIPNNKFNSLKTKHYQKIELSKFIDENQGKPFFVIKILFFYNKTFTKNESKN
jgi:hypothetical protein